MNLELITRKPRGASRSTPLLFVHGAFCGAWVWDEFFLPYFAEHGYEASALSLRGHGGSDGHATLAWTGLSDYVSDLAETVAAMDRPPVLIGHSMGGVVLQRYLAQHVAPAAVLMASGPPHGMLTAAVGMMLRNPVFYTQMCLMQTFGPRAASMDAVRRGVFSDRVARDSAIDYFARMQDESLRVVMDLALPYIPANRGTPLLVLGAGKDSFVAPVLVHATAAAYGAPVEVFPEMGHVMMLEGDWQRVAGFILHWLTDRLA